MPTTSCHQRVASRSPPKNMTQRSGAVQWCHGHRPATPREKRPTRRWDSGTEALTASRGLCETISGVKVGHRFFSLKTLSSGAVYFMLRCPVAIGKKSIRFWLADFKGEPFPPKKKRKRATTGQLGNTGHHNKQEKGYGCLLFFVAARLHRVILCPGSRAIPTGCGRRRG